jgi:predicted peptidase
MFLHGNGERGNGRDELDWVTVHGPLYEAWIQKRDLPFIIIAPQLHMFGMDVGVDYIQNRNPSQIPKRLHAGVPDRPVEFDTPTEMDGDKAASSFPYLWPPNGWERVAEDLAAIIQTVVDQYRGDRRRVYLTGLSYGGYGTWYMASKYPDLWAAINPIVGWGHPDLMKPIATNRIPVWAIAGGRDEGVPVRYFYPGLNKLESLGHPDVRFTVHEDMGHDTWRRVYAGEDIYSWFLAQRKN